VLKDRAAVTDRTGAAADGAVVTGRRKPMKARLFRLACGIAGLTATVALFGAGRKW
jgi:hypothetical protein